jgi:hypothetical protein
MVESKCSNSARCQLSSNPLDVRAAVAASEAMHQHNEGTARSPTPGAVIVQDEDVAVGKVDAMPGCRVPCCTASNKVRKQRLTMPASQQRVRMKRRQIISGQCETSTYGSAVFSSCLELIERRFATSTGDSMSLETTVTSQQTIQQNLRRVTFPELCTSIRTVINTGRLGTPVNVRLHWEFQESKTELSAVLTGAVALADEALKLNDPTWRVRRHSCGRTLNVLGSDGQGRTLLVTLVAEAGPRTAMTVFGNHGIVRFDDGWVDPHSIPMSLDGHSWISELLVALND